ncbi:hypothetical protein [Streptomyces sp. NPDC002386]
MTSVCEALAPYAWQSLRPEALCRRALAAMDRVDARPPLPGADERVAALAALLNGRPWRSLTVRALSRHLVSAAERWRQEQAWLDIQLGLLLDDAG